MSDTATGDPCDWCDDPVGDPLARTLRVTVDRSQIDSQRLCPECFAEWIDRYDTEMQPSGSRETEDSEPAPEPASDETDIIVD
jgi:hypothetical protein